MDAGKPGERGDVGIVLRQYLRVELGGAGGIVGGERGIGGFEQILLLAADAVLGDPLDEGDHLGFRQRAHETIDRLAVDEGKHRRNRLDAELLRDLRVLVDVHLDELDLALGGADDLFQDRAKLLAGPAPFGPEIHQHRLALRLLDHVLDERLGRYVLDQIIVRHRGNHPAILQHFELSLSAPEGV